MWQNKTFVIMGSPFFGKWTSVLLSAKLQNQIYIPSGFAHGFLALTENVQFLYKCSDFYDAADDHGIAWNDSEIAISWGTDNPVISNKDQKHPILATVPRDLPAAIRTTMKPRILHYLARNEPSGQRTGQVAPACR